MSEINVLKHTMGIDWSKYVMGLTNEYTVKPIKPTTVHEDVESVTFCNPATIIKFSDGVKVVVKATENDTFDPRFGFLMAYFERKSGLSKTQANKYLDKLEEEFIEQCKKREMKEERKNKKKEVK